jgi:hypothetical protein
MPTFDVSRQFWRDHSRLSPKEKGQLAEAVERFVVDLRTGGGFRAGLRVKGVQGAPGVFELTWADNGRATFEYGKAVRADEPHIIWRRVGGHEIFTKP